MKVGHNTGDPSLTLEVGLLRLDEVIQTAVASAIQSDSLGLADDTVRRGQGFCQSNSALRHR